MSKLASALRALPLLGMLAASAVHAQATPTTLVAPAAPATPGTPPPALPLDRPTVAKPKHPKQITANVSAGATLNGGNTKSYAGTFGGRLMVVRQPQQFTLEALGTLTASRAADDNKIHPTAGNVIGRARYDYFLTDDDALFAAIAPRSDVFAGLNLRLQNQLGYLRNLYNPVDNNRLWMEVGYDYTYDNLTKNWVPHGAAPLPPVADPTQHIHSGRGFLGYTNLMTAFATLNVGLEFLYDFQDSKNVRVNATGEFTSSISTRFKLSFLSRILFDNVPVDATKKKTDYISTVQLVFTYDSIKPPAACAACDCTKEVAAAKGSCAPTISPADGNPLPSAYIPAEPAAAPAAPVTPAPAEPAPAKPAP